MSASIQNTMRESLQIPKTSLRMFVFGLSWFFSFSLIGTMYGGELLALVFLPFLRPIVTLSRNALLKRVFISYFLILFGLVVSDVANETALEMALRGWSNLVFASITLWFVICTLRRHPIGDVKYFLVATIFITFLFGNSAYKAVGIDTGASFSGVLEDSNYFKVRIVPFLLPFLALLLNWAIRRSVQLAIILSLVSTLFLLAFDARSAGIIIFGVTLAIVFAGRLKAVNPKSMFCIFGVGMVLGYVAFAAYVNYSLSNNAGGHNARQLATVENPYNPLLLLAAGRSEWLVAGRVISKRPIIGYGSWAEDQDNEFSRLRAMLSGNESAFKASEGDRQHWIPTHSILITSWVWGGGIGMLGGMILVVLTFRIAYLALCARPDAIVLIVYFSVSLIWDLFFSPIQSLRLNTPVALGFLIAVASTQHPKNNLEVGSIAK